MKTISKAELINMRACKRGLERFIKQTNDTDNAVPVSDLFDGENTVPDLIWLASEICNTDKLRKFTRDIAMVNIELIKPYCNDADYESIIHFLKSGENDTRAARAVDAAADAAYAAYAAYAADAEYYAARAAARAFAAADAAYAAARADARADTHAMKAGEFDIKPFLQELFS